MNRLLRTVPGAPPPLHNPILDALLRDIRGRQAIVRALHEDDQLQPVDFIGTASIDDPAQDLANRITERLQFSLEDFRRQATTTVIENLDHIDVAELQLGRGRK